MTNRRPQPDPKRPRDTRPPTKPVTKPKPQPKLPPRPKKGLTVVGELDGLVLYRAEPGAIAASAPTPSSADSATIRRLLPPVRERAAA